MKMKDDYGYFEAVLKNLRQIDETQQTNIEAAAELMAEAIGQDRLISVYGGGGHTTLPVGEMFFRANGLRAGIQMFQSMFGRPSGNLMTLGLDTADYVVILYGCAVVGLVGILRERNLLDGHMLRNLKLPVRWAIYYGLILAVLIFGAYGVGYQQVDLIYAGF